MATSQIIYGGLSANTFSATTIYLGNNQLSSNTTFTGGTVTGSTSFTDGLSANTISATTYQNLPDNFTGNYLPLSGGTVTGQTFFTSGLTITGDTFIRDTSGITALDTSTRELVSSNSQVSIDWENRQLKDENGSATLVWSSQRTLEDLFGASLDWGNKYLYKSDGSIVLDWENGILTGQTNIQSSTISATTISGGTFYGDGSNLTGIGGGSSYIYEVGEYVVSEGGVIAHRWISTSSLGSPSGGTVQNYLVLDTTDLSTATVWSTGTTNISDVESFWDGLTNTNNLISAGDALGITPTSAAGLCYNSTNNGKTDWYLPSIGELAKVNSNRWEISQGLSIAGGTQLGNSIYWSSTEFTGILAWAFNFDSSVTTSQTKTISSYDVRAMRKFSI